MYSYSVDGTEYEGSAIARGNVSSSTPSGVTACIDRYPLGKTISVLYDPKDPSTAYLEVRRSTGAVILLGLGGLLTAIGALLVGLFFA